MKTHTAITLLCLAALPAAGHAACQTGLAERLHEKLHPGRELDHNLAACEPWRGNPGKSIVVLPMPRASLGDDEMDVDVLVVQQPDNGNSERSIVLSHMIQTIPTDAGRRIEDIKVDAARYRLAPEAHTFGLRTSWSNASQPNPASSETLSLYTLQGTRLRKVLDELEVNMERGQWDMSCSGAFEKRQVMMSTARTSTQGYADLLLRRSDWKTSSAMEGDDCVEKAQPPTYTALTLRFDGQTYQLRGANEASN